MTLVGNDSGGAYSQIAAAARPERIARLALNSCETPHDEFPPPPFDGLPVAARDTATLGTLLGALRDPAVRSLPAAFGLLVKHPLDARVSDSYALPCLCEEGRAPGHREGDVLGQLRARAPGRAHADRGRSPGRCCSPGARRTACSRLRTPRRYAGELADGHVEWIADAYSFTPEDQPEALARVLAAFAAD